MRMYLHAVVSPLRILICVKHTAFSYGYNIMLTYEMFVYDAVAFQQTSSSSVNTVTFKLSLLEMFPWCYSLPSQFMSEPQVKETQDM